MNFSFSEDHDAVRDLARKVLDDYAQPERLRDVERGPEPFDRELWSALGRSGLLGVGLAEPHGSGTGLIGTCTVLEEIGRRVTPLPAWTSAAVSALTLERFAPRGPAEPILPAMADGSTIVAAAFEEPLRFDSRRPATSARPAAGGWVLRGEKVAVPFGAAADAFLLSACETDGTASLFLVPAGADRLRMESAAGTSGEPLAAIHLDGVQVGDSARLGGAPGEAAAFAHQVALAGLGAIAAGVLAGGLEVTARYIGQRSQFGRPIASFQAAANRIADAYIDVQAVWMAAWSAIWKLDAGRPADEALAIAKFWVADGGQRAVHTFQHLHGGIGLDVDYPIHRYFTWAKTLETALGNASVQLDRLGAILAGED